MRYTLWSRDRLLGDTELAYQRCLPRHRMGDLVPTALGERLLASEVHHESLQFQLRGPDGRVIPTEWIDVRDVAFALTSPSDEDRESEGHDLDPEISAAVEHDLAVLREWDDAREPDGFWDDYDRDGDRPWLETGPWYQIQVRLLRDEDL